jgi:rubrerythrin
VLGLWQAADYFREEEIMTENPAVTNVEVLKVLELCREIEVSCSELYHYFEDIFSGTPGISGLWKKTALEEENHANQFVLAIKLRRQGLVQSVSVEETAVETVLNRVRSLLEKARQNQPGINDALLLAIDLEEVLSEFHLSSMALFQEESHKKLFEAMMKNDQNHVVDLKRAYEDRTGERQRGLPLT